jgi:hypothetical protein
MSIGKNVSERHPPNRPAGPVHAIPALLLRQYEIIFLGPSAHAHITKFFQLIPQKITF